jgi:hypothetical protein
MGMELGWSESRTREEIEKVEGMFVIEDVRIDGPAPERDHDARAQEAPRARAESGA